MKWERPKRERQEKFSQFKFSLVAMLLKQETFYIFPLKHQKSEKNIAFERNMFELKHSGFVQIKCLSPLHFNATSDISLV